MPKDLRAVLKKQFGQIMASNQQQLSAQLSMRRKRAFLWLFVGGFLFCFS